eukprot:TRINITY_DN1544_c0_g2_i4.p1 TRINITY_DN1544_c0_g2~~TRINITY_DN1544_c0_g2_i4.p1  ORF type:complete len:248 (+),score=30.21 TRINITY_DN1544_c0_g2_i4:63-806(+)
MGSCILCSGSPLLLVISVWLLFVGTPVYGKFDTDTSDDINETTLAFEINETVVSDLTKPIGVGDNIDLHVSIQARGTLNDTSYIAVFIISYPTSLELIIPSFPSTTVTVGADRRQAVVTYDCKTSNISTGNPIWCSRFKQDFWENDFSFKLMEQMTDFDIVIGVDLCSYIYSSCTTCPEGTTPTIAPKESYTKGRHIGLLLSGGTQDGGGGDSQVETSSISEGKDLTVILVPVLLGAAVLLLSLIHI